VICIPSKIKTENLIFSLKKNFRDKKTKRERKRKKRKKMEGEGGEEENAMSAAAVSITTILLFLVTVVFALLPLYWQNTKGRKRELIFGTANVFASGVFFSSALIHMLPEANEEGEESGVFGEYPIPFLVASLSYLFLFSLQTVLELLSKRAKQTSKPKSSLLKESETMDEIDVDNFEIELEEAESQVEDSHSHSHSHSFAAIQSMRSGGFSALTALIALSVHSLMEGAALGAQRNETDLIVIFIAIICHKGVDGLSLG